MEDCSKEYNYCLAGELAKQTGVSTDTLRHYERKGVLPRPRRSKNGYRLYPKDALGRVLLVRRAIAVGFTLDELAGILSERDKGGSPCRKVYKLASDKLARVEEQLTDLASLREDLQRILADWDKRLLSAPVGAQSGLLDRLATDDQMQPLSAANNILGNISRTKNKKGKAEHEKI
jgi:DNA-binding transcriptional MerR regulator